MRYFIGIICCLFLAYGATAQTVEICNDGIDNDGNGLTDCDDPACSFASNIEKGCNCFTKPGDIPADEDGDGLIDSADPDCAAYYGLEFLGSGSDCSITPPGGVNPFLGMGIPVVSGQNTADTQSKVVVGDVDGNGIPDVVITSKWNSQLRVVATTTGGGFAAGDIKSDFKLTGQGAQIFNGTGACDPKNLLYEHEVLIADIDKDGKAEIFGIVSNRQGSPTSPPTCFFLVAFKYAAGTLVPLYDAVQIGTNRPGVFGIADMDGDGRAEIYMRDRIYAAETGVLLATSNGDWDLDITSGPVAVNISGDDKMELVCGTKIFSIPDLTVNRSPLSPAPLVLTNDMNAISTDKCFVKLANDPVEYGIDTHSMCSVADIDRDGFVDVVISGALNNVLGKTSVFYWNVKKSTVSHFEPPDADPVKNPNGWPWGTGRVNLGDANGDGKTDMSFMAGNRLWCLTTNNDITPTSGGTLKQLWVAPRTINDSRSGVLTVTIYDFDNDGKPEMVYRDSQELAVIDGTTGQNKIWSAVCQSHTYTEGPVIADVNGDGATDICVPCYRNSTGGTIASISVDAGGSNYTTATVTITGGGGSGATATASIAGKKINKITITNPGSGYGTPPTVTITGDGSGAAATATIASGSFDIDDKLPQQALGEVRLFFSNTNGWLPTRKVWNQPGYFVVNIKDDLTLPFPQLGQNLVFSNAPCPNGTPGPQMPMNVFLNQVPFLNAQGCPVFPAPDLTFYGDDPANPGVDSDGDGVYTPAVVVTPPICGNTDVSAYFNVVNSGDLPITDTVPVGFFNGDPTNGGTYLLGAPTTTNINIAGLQIGQTFQSPSFSFNGPGVPYTLYIVLYSDGTLPLVINSTQECSIANNTYTVQINPEPYTVNIQKISDNTKCDLTVQGNGRLESEVLIGGVKAPLSNYTFQWYNNFDINSPIAGATNYDLDNLNEGDYSLVVTHKVLGCSSGLIGPVTIDRTRVTPDAIVTVLSDQTQCSPLNGKVEAIISGGLIGDIEWFDNFGPLGITEFGVNKSTVNGLQGDKSYLVRVTVAGCQNNSNTVPMAAPITPIAFGEVLQNVVDCLDPNSGVINAEAIFNSVIQPPGDFEFEWYSVPPSPGTPTLLSATDKSKMRTGLPAGFYQVEITQISTKCKLTPIPLVEVQNQTVIPVANINQLEPQTSCDVTDPNGKLIAEVLIGGVVQDPSLYTFEWFEGQNFTNNHLTVAGPNGEIAEKVKGGGIPYRVRVTSALNCSSFFDLPVTENKVFPVVGLNVTTPNSICDAALGFNGKLKADLTTLVGNLADYEYTWRNVTDNIDLGTTPPAQPALGADEFGSLNGDKIYSVSAFNTVLKCPSNVDTELLPNSQLFPKIKTDSTNSTNCVAVFNGNNVVNGQARVTTVDGIAPGGPGFNYNIQWYDGPGKAAIRPTETNEILDKIPGGFSYTVEIENTVTGCKNTDPVNLLDKQVSPSVTLGVVTPNSICDAALGFNGRVKTNFLIVAGNLADYTYTWTNVTDALALGVTPPQPLVGLGDDEFGGLEGAKTYNVVAANTLLGCTGNASVVLPNAFLLPKIKTDSIPSTNCMTEYPVGTNVVNGRAIVTTVDGIIPGGPGFVYNIQWYDGPGKAAIRGGDVNPILDKIQGGFSYTVEVENTDTGCKNTDPVNLPDQSEKPIIDLSVLQNNTVCSPLLPGLDYDGQLKANVTYKSVLQNPFPTPLPANYQVQWNGNPGVNGEVLPNLNAGNYNAIVVDINLGCISDADPEVIINDLTYPDLTIVVTKQTSCDDAQPNGQLLGTAAGGPVNFTFEWFDDVGAPVTQTATLGQTTPDLLGNKNYTIRVVDDLKGCITIENKYLPKDITYPTIDFNPVGAVTRCDNPDGSATPVLTNISALPTEDFTIYYVRTFTGNAFPTLPAAVMDPLNPIYGLTGVTPETYNGAGPIGPLNPPSFIDLEPGYLTGLVVDNNTFCPSDPTTVEIVDGTIPVTINVDSKLASSDCATGDGNMMVTVAGGVPIVPGPPPYNYTWYERGATPINTNINFFNNPPNMGAAATILNTKDLVNPGFILAGTYTLVVTDDVGCGAYLIDNVPFAASPVITVIKVKDNEKCSAGPLGPVTPDGSISINVAGASAFDYSVNIYNGPGATNPLIIPTTTGPSPVLINDPPGVGALSQLAAGEYFVEVIDNDPVNIDCPQGEVLTLKQAAFKPLVTTNLLTPNTSCTPATSGDGSITVTANKDASDTTVPNYEILDITPNPVGYIPPPPTIPIGPGGSTSAAIGGFGSGGYTIRVHDQLSECFTDVAINIPDQPDLTNTISATATPETYCAPSSDGGAIAAVNPSPVTDFNFEWYTDPLLTAPSMVYTDPGGGGTTGEIFDDSKFGYPAGTPGLGYGDNTFYVQGIKITGTGVGCPTGSAQVNILDQHAQPSLVLTPLSNTSCDPGIGEGRILVLASTTDPIAPPDPAVQNALYTYSWFPNPTGFPLPEINQNGATPYTISNLPTNTYNVTATNEVSGCLVTSPTAILDNKFSFAITQHTFANQLICDFDGRIDITEIVLDRSLTAEPNITFSPGFAADFDFEWYPSQVDPGLIDLGNPIQDSDIITPGDNIIGASLITGTGDQQFAAMGKGTYYVKATKKPGISPGAGCDTDYIPISIEDKHNDPVITNLTPFSNTSCVPALFEGRLEVAVNTVSGVPAESGSTYSYLIVGAAGNGSIPGGWGVPAGPGQAILGGQLSSLTFPPTYPAEGLADDSYTLTITNDYSNCPVTAGPISINTNKLPTSVKNFTFLNQLICNPDGRIDVTEVEVDERPTGPLGVVQTYNGAALAANFDFEWYPSLADPGQIDLGNPIQDSDIITPGDNIIGASLITGTGDQQFAAMGKGTYYVKAKKKPGLSPGAGCLTDAIRIDIEDLSEDPDISFSSIANSSCSLDPLKANGSLTGNAFERTGPVGNYDFDWNFNGAPLKATVLGVTTDLIANAQDGTYVLSVLNTGTGCTFDSPPFVLELDITRSTPNIIDVVTVDPLDCLASGSASVTKITLGSATNSLLIPPNPPGNNEVTGVGLVAFNYEWYEGSLANRLPLSGPPFNTSPVNPSMAPGTYLVLVEDPSTDCKSGPTEVVINDDLIIYPIVSIQQTARQISCDAITGTAALASTADGATAADVDYQFAWYNTLDATGPQIPPLPPPTLASELTDIQQGDYSVEVFRVSTGCSSKAFFIVPDEAPQFTPVVSLGGQERTLCVGQDGSVLARVIDISLQYPFPYNFSAELYSGNTVNPANLLNPSMAQVAGFNTNFLEGSLQEGFYTVKLIDVNTGCFAVATEEVVDLRTPPIVAIVEDNPLTNCDPAIANGQLSATADNGQVSGYNFSWYAGTAVLTPPSAVLSAINKLIGLTAGDFVVRATNNFTGCFTDLAGIITNNTLIPPAPQAVTLRDRTSCIVPNGLVAASVGGIIFGYNFDWYDGLTIGSSPDNVGANYFDLDIGDYSVIATDVVTGCASLPASTPVADVRRLPEFDIETTPSFCIDTGAPNGNGSVILNLTNGDSGEVVIQDVQWVDIATNAPVGNGTALYDLFPGFYQANVVTFEGCTNQGNAEVKTEIAPFNGVSNNSDGRNDAFIVDCISLFPNNNVKIFNRNGIKVYEATGYNNADIAFTGIGLDGLYLQGKELPVGTYYYIIDKRDGSKPVAGYLELDR